MAETLRKVSTVLELIGNTPLVQGNAVRDYVKWDDQPATIADFPASFARAYRIATTPAAPC